MKYIKLTFQAPLMAFGDATTSYQNVRDTATHPTKSMIAGLIACAMGIGREDSRAKEIADKITVYSTSLNPSVILLKFEFSTLLSNFVL